MKQASIVILCAVILLLVKFNVDSVTNNTKESFSAYKKAGHINDIKVRPNLGQAPLKILEKTANPNEKKWYLENKIDKKYDNMNELDVSEYTNKDDIKNLVYQKSPLKPLDKYYQHYNNTWNKGKELENAFWDNYKQHAENKVSQVEIPYSTTNDNDAYFQKTEAVREDPSMYAGKTVGQVFDNINYNAFNKQSENNLINYEHNIIDPNYHQQLQIPKFKRTDYIMTLDGYAY